MGSEYRYGYSSRMTNGISGNHLHNGYSRGSRPFGLYGQPHRDLGRQWGRFRDDENPRGEWDRVQQYNQMDRSKDVASDSRSVESLDTVGKQKSFRRLVVRFAEKTSMQGIPYINMAKLWWARLIWVIFTLVAVGFMIYHLYFLIDQYIKFPKQTSIELGFGNLRFPSITLCNVNVIRKVNLKDIPDSRELKQLIDTLRPDRLLEDDDEMEATNPPLQTTAATSGRQNAGQTTTAAGGGSGAPPGGSSPAPAGGKKRRKKRFVQQVQNLNLTDFDPNYEPEEPGEFEEDEFDTQLDRAFEIDMIFKELYMDLERSVRRDVGHQIEDMLISCTFNGRTCYPDNFTLHQSADYGNCWTIDSSKLMVRTSGPGGGLSLVLYLETLEFLEGITNGYGARLVIHRPGTMAFPTDEGVYIPASMETSIGLRMVAVERIGHPYGKCDPGTDFRSRYRIEYSRMACFAFCELSALLDTCSCFDDDSEELALSLKRNFTLCRTRKEESCMVRVKRDFALKKRTCVCENPCKETVYQRAVSNRQWPTDQFGAVLLQGVCEDQPEVCDTLRNIADTRNLNNNFLKLNIYYEDLNFENITESPEISDAQFLSDVGGAVGLWIGLSILSMCEILQLLAECLDYGVHRCRRSGERERRRRKRERRQQPQNINDPNSKRPRHESQFDNLHKNMASGARTGEGLGDIKKDYSIYSDYERPRI